MKSSDTGPSRLVVGTREEFRAIRKAGALLPPLQRRNFIMDCIIDSEDMDVMYIEVDYPTYIEWRRKYMVSYRLRELQKLISMVSLDAPLPNDKTTPFGEILESPVSLEDDVLEEIFMAGIREELAKGTSAGCPCALFG